MQKKFKPTGIIQLLFFGAIAATLGVVVLGGAVFWHFSRDLPKIISVADYRPRTVTRILAKNQKGEDEEIGEFFIERRYVVPYEKIPQIAVQAFISAEDDQFFEHPGINVASIIRASIANFRAGHVVQGGSTITQQVAKSLLLSPERTFGRKIKEVILASRLEHNLSKQQILYLYLNQIYLGHGAYGIQAASRTFFRKDANELTIAEAALLAGMPQAPGKYSPLLNPKRAKERQLYVLRRLYENKYITQAQMTDAAAKQLKIYHEEDVNSRASAYLIEQVRRYAVEKYGEKAVYEDGLTIRVPATPELASVASRSLKEGLRVVDKRYGYRGPLQHLASTDDIEKYLKDQRTELIEKRIQHVMLLPDGHIDAIEAMHQAGYKDDVELLESGEIYPAVVTSLDEKHRSAGVMIGGARAELPAERTRWANAAPTKLFKRGDVILVRAETLGGRDAIVSLEQEPQLQGALFSMDAATGNVLAMEGGYDYDQSEFNRAVQAQRQPGSAFKPIIYASALEKGYTPASIIVDSPIVYQDADSKWKPANFEEKFYGDTTFRQALIKSRNVPTIKIVQNVGVQYVINYAKRLGFDSSKFNEDLSISLGSTTVSLADITRVYALFPRLGRKINPIYLTQILDRDGKPLEEVTPSPLAPPHIVEPSPSPSPSGPAVASEIQPGKVQLIPPYPPADDPDQVLDPRVAYVMTHIMKEVVEYGTGHEAKALGRAAAGKTGTTNEYQDAWFVGFTPHVVTGVWVGYDNQKSIGRGETGARAALPIWLSFMKEAVKNYPEVEFTVPPGISFASIDAQSGKLAPPNSSRSIQEAFIEGTQPTESSDLNNPSENQPQTQGDFFKEDIE
jgi:penicillin-binding protein 1A